MPRLLFEGREFERASSESVLDALLRHGVDAPYSCKKGTCLTCLVRAEADAAIPPEAQANLKETLRVQRYLLACQCRPEGDIALRAAAPDDLYQKAAIERVEKFGRDVARIFLRPQAPLDYAAGQFINLRRPDSVTRSYSLASLPRGTMPIEIHVRRYTGGALSQWLCDPARAGTQVALQGPHGNCFYVSGREDQPMLLVGTGTGLAPLLGILRTALALGHRGAIRLYHGSHGPEGVYFSDELFRIAAANRNFSFSPCVSGPRVPEGYRQGRADRLALADHPSLAGMRVFACGRPEMVQSFRQDAYIAGASLSDIHGDAFELRDLRRPPRGEFVAAAAS